MKTVCVILLAFVVAVTSAARLPSENNNSKLSLNKFAPFLQNVVDLLYKNAKGNEIAEHSELLEEFRRKPMNWKALVEKVENIDKHPQNAAELFDKEEANEHMNKAKEINENGEEQKEDNAVEKAINMAKEEDESDIQLSFGLPEPIDSLTLKKNIDAGDDDEEEDDENESILPKREIKEDEEEQIDENDVQISFGLDEPIEAKKFAAQVDADDDDEDDDEADEIKSSDLNEKVMLEVMKGVIQKFAKAYDFKL